MKKLLILLLVGIFFISFASAIPTYKQNDTIQLTAVCDNCTFVNLTKVTYPNGSFALLGQFSMTKTETNYNYTFSDTNALGIYKYVTCGDLNGILNCGDTEDRSFKITPNGDELTNAQAILNLLFLIASLFIVGFFLYFAITIEFQNPRNMGGFYVGINGGKWMKIICIVMSYTTLMWFFALLSSTANNYLSIGSMGQFFYYFYYVMLSLLWPLIVVIAVFSFIIWLKDMKISKGLKQHLRMK